jgi:dephospho-CoA kinase
MNRHAFAVRDERELMVGLGSAIAMADHVITNEGTLEQFKKRMRMFLEEYLRD